MRQKLLYGAAGLVLVLGLVAASLVAYRSTGSGTKTVSAEVTAYTSKPPYKVTIEVDKPPADTVKCVVYAIDFNSNAVGEVDNIVVGPQTGRSTRLSLIVPTKAPPTQFQVEECLVQKIAAK